MPDVKTLQDFYNPTQTLLPMIQMQQYQQHIGMQQQQMAQQGRNMEIDNLQNALKTSDPMQSYPIYQQLHQKLGLPVQSVTDYYANLPYAKVQQGAKELNVKVGLGDSPNLAALTADKPAVQSQVANAAAQSPLQQEQFKALQLKVQEHTNIAANVNTQINALLPVVNQAGLGIERSAPHVDALAAIQQQYDKNVKSVGITKAAKMKDEMIKANPDLQQFNDRRMQGIPQAQQLVQQIQDKQSQLETRAEALARGAAPLKDGESLPVLAGTIDASHQHLAYAKAQLAFAKNPTPANLDALKTVKTGMDTYIEKLTETKNASQDALAMRQAGLDEKKLEYQDKIKRQAAIGKAQVEWMKAGGALGQAYKYAEKYGVHVDEVSQGAKDPNKAGVEIKMPNTTNEAGHFSMIDNAVKSVDAVTAAITKPDGSIDRAKVLASNLNLPFTEGRNIGSMMEDAISAKLRAETGAAANAEEVKSILRRFDVSSMDTDTVIKSKLSRLRRFLDETRIIRDSTGKIRETAGTSKAATAAPSPASTPGSVAPFTDAEKEARYQEFKRNHK